MKNAINNEMLENAAEGIELSNEALENVCGGGPRVRIGGPKRNQQKIFTDVYHLTRKLVKTITDKYWTPYRDKDGNPISDPLFRDDNKNPVTSA